MGLQALLRLFNQRVVGKHLETVVLVVEVGAAVK
jgi:hypothetical protein